MRANSSLATPLSLVEKNSQSWLHAISTVGLCSKTPPLTPPSAILPSQCQSRNTPHPPRETSSPTSPVSKALTKRVPHRSRKRSSTPLPNSSRSRRSKQRQCDATSMIHPTSTRLSPYRHSRAVGRARYRGLPRSEARRSRNNAGPIISP